MCGRIVLSGYDRVKEGQTIPTIKDVAELAGVSVATVSAVINKNVRVSERLTKKVNDAIRELDYRPNLTARALHTRRTQTIGLLVPSLANPFFGVLVQAAENVAHEAGYSVLVGSTDGETAKANSYMDRMLQMGVDGLLIVLSWDIVTSGILEKFSRQNIPVVGTGGARPIEGMDCLVSDDVYAGEQATRYLLGLGHRNIAFVGTADSMTTTLRYEGVKRALLEVKPALDDAHLSSLYVESQGYSQDYAKDAVTDLIVRGTPFSAVIAFNDVIALGTLNALEEQGFQVPEDVSVVGFDDTVSVYTRPRLTTVACNKEILGEEAVRRLIARIEGDDQPFQTKRFKTRLIVRESSSHKRHSAV